MLLSKVTARVFIWSTSKEASKEASKEPPVQSFKEPSKEPAKELSVESPKKASFKESSAAPSTSKSMINTDDKLELRNYYIIEDIVENCLHDIHGICVEAEQVSYMYLYMHIYMNIHLFIYTYIYIYIYIHKYVIYECKQRSFRR
jgi:hypothetical protein